MEDLERLPAPPFFAVADMVHSLVPRVGLELLLAEARSSRVLEFLACLTDPLWISSDYLRLASCHHSWPGSPSATKPLPVTPARLAPSPPLSRLSGPLRLRTACLPIREKDNGGTPPRTKKSCDCSLRSCKQGPFSVFEPPSFELEHFQQRLKILALVSKKSFFPFSLV